MALMPSPRSQVEPENTAPHAPDPSRPARSGVTPYTPVEEFRRDRRWGRPPAGNWRVRGSDDGPEPGAAPRGPPDPGAGRRPRGARGPARIVPALPHPAGPAGGGPPAPGQGGPGRRGPGRLPRRRPPVRPVPRVRRARTDRLAAADPRRLPGDAGPPLLRHPRPRRPTGAGHRRRPRPLLAGPR